jgi:hypothetical protein
MYLVVARSMRIFMSLATATSFADKEAVTENIHVRVYKAYVGAPLDFDELLYIAEPRPSFKSP